MGTNFSVQFRDDEVVVRRSKINGEWTENKYIKIGGKLRILHQENEHVSINTEMLKLEADWVVCRATVVTAKGTFTGTGVATLKMDARIGDAIVSLSETRAIARACRHAGYAMDSCGAEELTTPEQESETVDKQMHSRNSGREVTSEAETKPANGGTGKATSAQCRALNALAKRANYTGDDIDSLLRPLNAATFQELTRESASKLISYLQTEVAA
jgi:hypothetical protein